MSNFASAEDPAIAAAMDFSRFAHVVDVGAGQGGLLAQVLQRHAGVRATLYDRPEVARNPAALLVATEAQPSLKGRWVVQEGDFFELVPARADCYVLKRILHDWGDEDCVRILTRCREAMAPGGTLLVVDAVLPEGNAPHPAKVMDILMMVLAGGRERRAPEFAGLLERAGLRLEGISPTASALSVISARAG
jgi:hypothetical protein